MSFYCLSLFYVYIFIHKAVYVYKYFAKISIPNTTETLVCNILWERSHALHLSVLNENIINQKYINHLKNIVNENSEKYLLYFVLWLILWQ